MNFDEACEQNLHLKVMNVLNACEFEKSFESVHGKLCGEVSWIELFSLLF